MWVRLTYKEWGKFMFSTTSYLNEAVLGDIVQWQNRCPLSIIWEFNSLYPRLPSSESVSVSLCNVVLPKSNIGTYLLKKLRTV